jgi:hypothetical protein
MSWERNAIEGRFLKWTGFSGAFTDIQGDQISLYWSWGRFNALEMFYGEKWSSASSIIHAGWLGYAFEGPLWTMGRSQCYREIFEGYYGALMAQTHLKDLYDRITSTWNVEKHEYETDMNAVIVSLKETLTADPEQGKLLLGEFARTWRGLNNGASWADWLPYREVFIQMDPSLGWVFDSGGLPVYNT